MWHNIPHRREGGGAEGSASTVKLALVTTCMYSETTFIQIPLGHVPIVTLQCIFTSIKRLRIYLHSKTTFFWPKRGRLIQVSLYSAPNLEKHFLLLLIRSSIVVLLITRLLSWVLEGVGGVTHSACPLLLI